MHTTFPDGTADETQLDVRKRNFVPSLFMGGGRTVLVSANSLDNQGSAGVVYMTFSNVTHVSAAATTSGGVDPGSALDSETLELVSDVRFMELLELAERDISEGRGISGEDLRRRRG